MPSLKKSSNLNSKRLTIFLVIILVIISIFFIYYSYLGLEIFTQEHFGSNCIDFIPFKRTPEYETKKGTIFISIASYRDKECSMTVETIFKKAKNPQNVFLGICEQNKKDVSEEECFSPNVKQFIKNIRYHNMDYIEAKGPTYARYWCSKLWKGEEYFLQIDSHTFFEQDWDSNLIKMLEQCRYSPEKSDKHPYGPEGSKKPVLSVYPATDDQLKLKGFPVMDSGKLGSNKIPVFLAGFWNKISSKPIRSPKPFIAAGYFFCDANFLNKVPYDPNLSNLFQGEETLFSARMFTHGYDIFSPNINICSHHYSRDGPLYFNDIPNHNECRSKAEKKVLFLLNLTPKKKVSEEFLRDYHKYGFGSVRKLDDFWKAGGIDFKKKGQEGVERWGPETKDSANFPGWNFYLNDYKKIKKV